MDYPQHPGSRYACPKLKNATPEAAEEAHLSCPNQKPSPCGEGSDLVPRKLQCANPDRNFVKIELKDRVEIGIRVPGHDRVLHLQTLPWGSVTGSPLPKTTRDHNLTTDKIMP